MVTKAKDTIDYDFKVLVPAPTVNSISCEFAKPGSEVTLEKISAGGDMSPAEAFPSCDF